MATMVLVKRTFLDFAEISDDTEGTSLRRSCSDPVLGCRRGERPWDSDGAEAETEASGGAKGCWSSEETPRGPAPLEDGWSTDSDPSDTERARVVRRASGDTTQKCAEPAPQHHAAPGGGSCHQRPSDFGDLSAFGGGGPAELGGRGCQQAALAVAGWAEGVLLPDWGSWTWAHGPQGQPPHGAGVPAWLLEEQQAAWLRAAEEPRKHRRRTRRTSEVVRAGAAVPREAAPLSAPCPAAAPRRQPLEDRTTVMLRNLPNNYSRAMLLELMDSQGFAGKYDFVYLPIDFSTQSNIGYAFVNLLSAATAGRFWEVFDGFSAWSIPSRKVCFLSWSDPCQGLEANVERYRNSPVMCGSVPEDYKPVVFLFGAQVDFPAPVKKLRPPRLRKGAARALAQQSQLDHARH